MATFTIRIKKQRKDGTRPVRIRIVNNYTECELGTVWAVTERDLNRAGEIKNVALLDEINGLLRHWRQRVAELGTAAAGMTAREIAALLTPGKEREEDSGAKKNDGRWRLDICEYMERDADRLEREGSAGTAGVRRTALRSLQAYTGEQTIDINDITTAMLNGWVEWLCARNGKRCRAASLYPTQLRAVFNRARKEFNTDEATPVRDDPFARMERVRMPVSRPRSITAEQVRAIAALPDRGGRSRFDLARDVFMLSFYLMGMNSVDLYLCPPVKDGRVTYERAKTRSRRDDRALISVAVPPEAEGLMAKYAGHRKDRAFSFCERFAGRGEFSAALNHGLKEVGEAVGAPGLQFYAARHTWASVAVNDAGVDKYTVHQALNHVDDKTAITDIYIRRSWAPLDAANRKVIEQVFGR